jgi:hypothetical protein
MENSIPVRYKNLEECYYYEDTLFKGYSELQNIYFDFQKEKCGDGIFIGLNSITGNLMLKLLPDNMPEMFKNRMIFLFNEYAKLFQR